MDDTSRTEWLDPKLLIPALLGALFALLLYGLWDLEWRLFTAVVLGVLGLSGAMVLLGQIGNLGLYVFLFTIPFASIEKWFFTNTFPAEWRADMLWSGYIGLGPIDLVLAGLYVSWIFRIFVTRETPLPRLQGLDVFVLLLVAAYCISLVGAPRLNVGVYATVYLLKHVLAYFYLSRHLMRRHLRWVVASVLFSIALQGSLGFVQTQFHVLEGIARTKGANVQDQEQAEVRGIESFTRAEGTLLDSHSYGLHLAMLLPVPFMLLSEPSQRRRARNLFALVFLAGAAMVVLSFSRSAWLGFAASILAGIALMAATGHPRVRRTLVATATVALLLAPWALQYLWLRFARGPSELIDWRIDGYVAALPIWRDHLLFGIGVGNFLDGLRLYSANWAPEVVVHNMILWIGTEMGLFGLFAWFGIIVTASLRCLRVIRTSEGLVRALAYAPIIAFVAYCVDGMTEPLYREPVVFMWFWSLVALSAALTRIHAEERASRALPAAA